MSYRKFLSTAALAAGALCLGASFLTPKPAAAQDDICPYGYYYIASYGCAPLSYYAAPDLLPGFGFYYGWGRGYRGGYYRGPNYNYRGGSYHAPGGFRGSGRHR